MGKNGRLVGFILIIVGLLILLGCSAVSLVSSITAEGAGSMGGAVLGIVLSIFVGLVPIAVGVYLVIQGRTEAAQQADAVRQRKILDMVKTRGQLDLRDVALELNASSTQVRDDVYKLVGLGLFTGYVSWDNNTLYSREASQMRGNTCPNCGGQLEVAGKGVIACQNCGAEIFL